MRTRIVSCAAACLALSASLSLVAPGKAAEGKGDKAAWEVIDKAIAATGAKKLVELPGQTWTETGTFHGGGAAQPYTATFAQLFPGKMRMEIAGAFVMVVDEDKGWIQVGGATQEIPADQLKAQKNEFFAGYVATLAPLAGDRSAFTATSLAEAEVAGRPTEGVSIKSDGRLEIKLYFDKETHLPAKIGHRAHSTETGAETDQEITLSEYKDIDGVKTSMKYAITRDGAVYIEGAMSDVKHLKTLDDGQFAKP